MDTRQKYVRLKEYDSFIFFPMIIEHSTFKHLQPISAGFCYPQTKQLKHTKNIFVLWIDEFEGGEAYQDDWTYLEEFKSHESALQYILDNYGEVEKISDY